MNGNRISRCKHVLIIVQNCPIESDRRVEREVVALRDAGYRVSLICPASPQGVPEKQIDCVDIHRFTYSIVGDGMWSYMAEYTESLAKILLLALRIRIRSRVDLVQTCNPPDILFIVGAVFKLFGARFIFDQHDPAPEVYCSRISRPRRVVYWVLRLFERISFVTADAICVTNGSAKRAASRSAGRLDKIHVVRNGPSITLPSRSDESLKRSHRYMACCMGTMAPQDGGDCIIKIAEYIIRGLGRKDILFTVVGGGSALEEMKRRAHEKGLSDHIDFTGWIYDRHMLGKYLSTADICISPEPSSACNNMMTFIKVLDYMAAGKPIVAFDLPETRVSAGDAALYAAPNDIADFSVKVIGLLDDERRRSRMGDAARFRLQRGLLWEDSKPIYLRIYEQLLGDAQVQSRTRDQKEKAG